LDIDFYFGNDNYRDYHDCHDYRDYHESSLGILAGKVVLVDISRYQLVALLWSVLRFLKWEREGEKMKLNEEKLKLDWEEMKVNEEKQKLESVKRKYWTEEKQGKKTKKVKKVKKVKKAKKRVLKKATKGPNFEPIYRSPHSFDPFSHWELHPDSNWSHELDEVDYQKYFLFVAHLNEKKRLAQECHLVVCLMMQEMV